MRTAALSFLTVARLAAMQFMDHAGGTYIIRDGAGNAVGVGDMAAALKVREAYERYCDWLSNAHRAGKHRRIKPVADAADGDPRMVAYAAYKQRLQDAHKQR